MRFEDYFTFQDKQAECRYWINKKSYIYYGGARGGGKTYAAVGIAMMVACQFPGIQIVVMRKSLEELKQYIIKTFRNVFPEGQLYQYKTTDKVVKLWNGSNIHFRPMRDMEDALKEQGIGRHMYIIDEANQIPAEILVMLKGSLRNGEIRGWKPCMLFTGNPGGLSDLWFKDRFIYPRLEKWEEAEREEAEEYIFIQAKLDDNQILTTNDPTYRRKLMAQPEHRRKAWLDGDWNVFAGQFFEAWNEAVHVVDEFDPPHDWPRWRGVDLGRGTHPSVCLWLAQNPEDGVVYCYRELANFETPSNFARQIVEMTGEAEHFIATFADPNIWAENNLVYDNEQYFRQAGIFLTKSSNKRSIGWSSMKQWLDWKRDVSGEFVRHAHLKVCRNCAGLIETLPILQYAGNGKEDCNTSQQDDYADALRYFVMGVEYGWKYNNKGMQIGEFVETERPIDPRYATESKLLDIEEDDYFDSFGDGGKFNYADFGDIYAADY